jgi:hypothetical protein
VLLVPAVPGGSLQGHGRQQRHQAEEAEDRHQRDGPGGEPERLPAQEESDRGRRRHHENGGGIEKSLRPVVGQAVEAAGRGEDPGHAAGGGLGDLPGVGASPVRPDHEHHRRLEDDAAHIGLRPQPVDDGPRGHALEQEPLRPRLLQPGERPDHRQGTGADAEGGHPSRTEIERQEHEGPHRAAEQGEQGQGGQGVADHVEDVGEPGHRLGRRTTSLAPVGAEVAPAGLPAPRLLILGRRPFRRPVAQEAAPGVAGDFPRLHRGSFAYRRRPRARGRQSARSAS